MGFLFEIRIEGRDFRQRKGGDGRRAIRNAFHSVMENFAKSAVADSTDWSEIFSFMSERLDALSKATFGRFQRMQIRMQIENLRNRLGSVARVQAQRRSEGWKISETEVPFEFSECGRRFAGRIDRIDARENPENSPEYAVLDYKTADKVSPDYVEREHLTSKGEWKNLQLPLYVRAAADIYPGRKISCGYFLVPKDLSQTGVQMWDNFRANCSILPWKSIGDSWGNFCGKLFP